MSDLSDRDAFVPDRSDDLLPATMPRLPLAAHYALALLLVAVATAFALTAQRLISAPNLTLIYVLPVIIAASVSGWGPSLLAVAAGATAFDFFFTEPYYSLTMTNPPEIWALVLLLTIATIVASVSAQSRRRALKAVEAAERAEALQAVAHAAIHFTTQRDLLETAAMALHRIFRAPAIILMQRGSDIETAATAGGARSTEADLDAARGALSSRLKTRGQMYPYVRTYFDFWPVSLPAGYTCVLGVDFAHSARERPDLADNLVEGVAGYIASALVRDQPAVSA